MMPPGFRRRSALLSALLLVLSGPFCAAGEKHPPAGSPSASAERPLVVLHLAGVNRLLQRGDYISRVVGHPELAAVLRGTLSVATAGLKGIDRARPLGVMTYINPGEAPEPVAVLYVPVVNQNDFLAMLRASGHPVEKKTAPRGFSCYRVGFGRSHWVFRFEHGYAFFARQRRSLQRSLGDPARRFASLTAAGDAVLRIQLDAIPRPLKEMVLDYLRSRAEWDLVRRSGETPSAFLVRRRRTDVFLGTLASAFRDGRRLDVVLKLSSASSAAQLTLRYVVQSGKKLPAGKLPAKERDVILPKRMRTAASLWLHNNLIPPQGVRLLLSALVAHELQPFGSQPGKSPRSGNAPAKRLSALAEDLLRKSPQFVVWTLPNGNKQPVFAGLLIQPRATVTAEGVEKMLNDLAQAGLLSPPRREKLSEGQWHIFRFLWRGKKRGEEPPSVAAAWAVAVSPRFLCFVTDARRVREMLSVPGSLPSANSPEAVRPVARPAFELSVRWSLVQSLLPGRSPTEEPAKISRPAGDSARPSDYLHLSVECSDEELVLTTRLDEGLLALWGQTWTRRWQSAP